MASKRFGFIWNFSNNGDVIETAKAYGFKYQDRRYMSSNGEKIMWLPKSQVIIEPVPEPQKGTREYISWDENDREVSVPMWLAEKNNYFENMLQL